MKPSITLDNLAVASPCSVDWNSMTGDERKRHCALCKLNVYNISGMTKPDAEAFLRKAEGRVCVRFYRRTDGTVLTRDCPVGMAQRLRNGGRKMLAAAAMLLGLIGGAFGWVGCSPQAGDPVPGKSGSGQPGNDGETGGNSNVGQPLPPEIDPEPHMGFACPDDMIPPPLPQPADNSPAPGSGGGTESSHN